MSEERKWCVRQYHGRYRTLPKLRCTPRMRLGYIAGMFDSALPFHRILSCFVNAPDVEWSFGYVRACASPTLPGTMPFRVAISTAPDPQGSGRVDIHTHPYTTAACAAGVVTGTAVGTARSCYYDIAITGTEGHVS